MNVPIQEKIYLTFSAVASSLGYSEVHGRIISVLLAEDKPLSLEELSAMTDYSPASISLSLDLLEILGVVKRVKQKGDRKLYIKLDGDLLEALRNALLIKLRKEINQTLNELSSMKAKGKERKTVIIVQKEIRRLDEYIKRLSKVPIPQK